MGGAAVRWAKFVIPLVVHSAPKVRLRAAATLEMGMPLLLEKQKEVATIIEPMMSSVGICVREHFSVASVKINMRHLHTDSALLILI